MKIKIETVEHEQQRYPTVGDYIQFGDETHFYISKMKEPFELLVAIHEVIEWYLVQKRGVPLEDIDRFDIEYEKTREKGDVSEPGDSRLAPYYWEHQVATAFERMLATYIGVDWKEYSTYVESL